MNTENYNLFIDEYDAWLKQAIDITYASLGKDKLEPFERIRMESKYWNLKMAYDHYQELKKEFIE